MLSKYTTQCNGSLVFTLYTSNTTCYSGMCCQHLDFWSEPSSFADTIFLRVSPKQSDLVEKLLTDAGIPHEVVVSDLQRSVGVVLRTN